MTPRILFTIRNTVLNNGSYATSAYKTRSMALEDLFIEDVTGLVLGDRSPTELLRQTARYGKRKRASFSIRVECFWILGN